ncbi:MAG: glycerol-3-phosphate dehydrogenase [Bdellovibrionales bacterium]
MTGIDYDLCVIGGGINGAGIARDAAGRGLKVLLLEAQDLASGTSSSSTKLIHGGLRYLEYYEFKMVRDALIERERLLSIAPHIIWPMDFVLPHTPAQRPAWMIRLGLCLYDYLAPRKKLAASSSLSFHADDRGAPILDDFKRGFSYADCWADDSRLVVLNALSASQHGAKILTRHRCVGLEAQGQRWRVTYQAEGSRSEAISVHASMVINAAGPWVRTLLDQQSDFSSDDTLPSVRLVKGSHIIVPRQFEGEHAYILQQSDNRIIFAIPYEHDYTLIGTTEEDLVGDPKDARISDDEMSYLINAYNLFFKVAISKDDVQWTYSGVRPLYSEVESGAQGNATSATRDYKLHVHDDFAAPIISVFGGKLTTYRKLAEQAVDKILKINGRNSKAWTADEPLPGGDIKDQDFDAFLVTQGQRYKWLPKKLLYRYARSYGTSMDVFLQGARQIQDLGEDFSGHVFEAEILYLLRYEFAQTVEDILWRRSKLGLHVDDRVVKNLAGYIRLYWKDRM